MIGGAYSVAAKPLGASSLAVEFEGEANREVYLHLTFAGACRGPRS